MNNGDDRKFPPEKVEQKALHSFNDKEVIIAKLSPSGLVNFTGKIVKHGVCISQADFGDLLIDSCVVDPVSILKDIFVQGGGVEEAAMELMALCVSVNPQLHPRRGIFFNPSGVVLTSSSPPKGFSPIASNNCWDFPLRTVKYSGDSFLSFEDLSKRGYRLVYWKQRALYLAIKMFSTNEIEMLSGFKNQLHPMYYRILVGCYGVGHYHSIKSLLKITSPEEESSHVKELYAAVVQQNPALIMGKDNKLPMDLDDSVSLELKNKILEDIEKFIEEESEDSEDTPTEEEDKQGEGKLFTTETGRDKKGIHKLQTAGFESVKTQDIVTLGKRIKAQVFGQDDAVDKLVAAIKRAKVGLTDGTKPIATAILTGQTGSGKTHLAKILCDELVKDKKALVRIDCGEYGLEHEAMKLLGSPPSFVGYEDGGYLTNKLIQYPFCVVLFDEIEKAHPRMYDILLQVFDDARLTDGKGKTVSFNQAIIIMTSNLGSRELDKEYGTIPSLGFGSAGNDANAADKIVSHQLKRHFKPEFINRIDEVIVFKPLTVEVSRKIAAYELGKLRKLLVKKGYKVLFDDSVLDYLVNKGFSKEYGARPLIRTIKKDISDRLADNILASSMEEMDKVIVYYQDNDFVFERIPASKETKDVVDELERLVSK